MFVRMYVCMYVCVHVRIYVSKYVCSVIGFFKLYVLVQETTRARAPNCKPQEELREREKESTFDNVTKRMFLVCMYVCMYACMHVCVYVCTYM